MDSTSESRLPPWRLAAWIVGALWLWLPTAAGQDTPDLRFEGVGQPAADNIRAFLTLAGESCDSPRWRVEQAFSRAGGEIFQALRPLGYYRPEVVDRNLAFTDTCWQARFTIVRGRRVMVESVDVRVTGEGVDDEAFHRAVEAFPLKPGEPLDHGRYEQGKSALQTVAQERGYFDAQFSTSRLAVDPDRSIARIVVEFDSGNRYRFGATTIRQGILDESLMQRFLIIEPGRPYSSEVLSRQYRLLADSGYFRTVEVTPRVEEARDRTIPIVAELTPQTRQTFSFGVGAATDTGPRVTTDYENRYINRRGHRASASLRLATEESEMTASYSIPLRDPNSERLTFYAGYRDESTTVVDSTTAKIGVSRSGVVGEDWIQTFSLELLDEDSTIGTDEVSATLLVPGVSWARTRADDRLRPTRGERLFLEPRAGFDALGSDADFVQATARGKWIRTLYPRGRVILRADLGATWTDEFRALPATFRYFAGGDNSIRGYRYRSLGPRDENGDVIGGRYLAVASAEFEHRVTDSIGVAAFVDSGNAFMDSSGEAETGVGLGVRWYSPVGPLRLDFAHPLDNERANIRVHFTMGLEL